MKKLLVPIVIIISLIFAGSSWATTITIDRVSGYYSGYGGEFNISGFGESTNNLYDSKVLINNLYGNQGFETFCLEYNEHVSIPGTYNAAINPDNQAWNGGINTDTGDTISKGTAYLYYQFSQGLLDDYNYVGDRATSAGLLQNTIWYLEDEISNLSSNVFTELLIKEFGSLANAKGDIDKDYGVGVLNLTTLSGGLAQDQLVLTPVPEPTTLLLLGFGLIGLAGAGRKFKK